MILFRVSVTSAVSLAILSAMDRHHEGEGPRDARSHAGVDQRRVANEETEGHVRLSGR
jgi:hypothetical protein